MSPLFILRGECKFVVVDDKVGDNDSGRPPPNAYKSDSLPSRPATQLMTSNFGPESPTDRLQFGWC
jgi:hypothetical protein